MGRPQRAVGKGEVGCRPQRAVGVGAAVPYRGRDGSGAQGGTRRERAGACIVKYSFSILIVVRPCPGQGNMQGV
ncbi:hypothetical protein MF6396_15430 [Pseudomonas sp. MF6396]|nr:hypothetical protein MF6396_15430 [Pseudomonas sp. MF6396]